MTTQKLPNWRLAAYAGPAIVMSFVNVPTTVVLPTLYVETTQATLAGVGLVNLLRWWVDAVSDPVVGYMSDRTKSPWGSRKPWIVAGALMSAFVVFFLFRPGESYGNIAYGIGLFSLYIALTIFVIPYQAWGSELATSAQDRSRIAGYYSIGMIVGTALFWITPLLLAPVTGTTEMTPEALSTTAWLFLLLVPFIIFFAIRLVPARPPILESRSSLRDMWKVVAYNRPMLRLVIVLSLWGIGNGVSLSVVFIIIRDYLQLGPQFPLLMLIITAVHTISIPIWVRILNKVEKHKGWAISLAGWAVLQPVILLIEPGAQSLPIIIVFIVLVSAIQGANYIAPFSIVGDIADYGMLKMKSSNTANYFAIRSILDKMSTGVGAGITFPLLGFLGYQLGGENTDGANAGLLAIYIGVPALASLLAAAIIWSFPITSRKHNVIFRRLESIRTQREAGK